MIVRESLITVIAIWFCNGSNLLYLFLLFVVSFSLWSYISKSNLSDQSKPRGCEVFSIVASSKYIFFSPFSGNPGMKLFRNSSLKSATSEHSTHFIKKNTRPAADRLTTHHSESQLTIVFLLEF